MKEMLMMMHHMSQPEYVHVLLNPMPLYGMAAGAFLLVWSRLPAGRQACARPREFPEGALIWIILVALVTGLAVYFGEQGYENVGAIADAHGNRWLAQHKERAETLMYIFYLTGLCALGSLWAQRRRPSWARHLVSLTLVLTFLSMGAASWISHAGGQVMHAEFR
jgi:hypothetical protein